MAKCDKCLRGTRVRTTGVNPANTTLKMEIGGAVLYVMPGANGKIDVTLNTQNLNDGDYAVCIWDGERWSITTMGPNR
jgi:hypothetical protein